MRWHRTTIEVDLDALTAARETLGTRGFKDTVNAALWHVGRDEALARAAERVRENRFRAPEPETLESVRRARDS